jgi:putative FmdB family regulatory protein
MPTYEYACEACAAQFERLESIKARPLRKCPKCGRNKLQRLIGTGAGIIFKGSGFYETDYRSESYKKGAESEKKGTEKTTEKPAEKPAEKKDKSQSKDSKAESKSEAASKQKRKSA